MQPSFGSPLREYHRAKFMRAVAGHGYGGLELVWRCGYPGCQARICRTIRVESRIPVKGPGAGPCQGEAAPGDWIVDQPRGLMRLLDFLAGCEVGPARLRRRAGRHNRRRSATRHRATPVERVRHEPSLGPHSRTAPAIVICPLGHASLVNPDEALVLGSRRPTKNMSRR